MVQVETKIDKIKKQIKGSMLRAIFNKLDTFQHGFITRVELVSLFKEKDIEGVTLLVQRLNKDRANGQVTLPEFL